MRVGLRRKQLEPARQVRVEHVEAAGAELELAGLRVDDAPRRRARPVPSAADTRCTARRRPRAGTSPSSSLDDRSDPAAPKRQHRERRRRGRASRRPSPRDRPTVMRSSGVWMSCIPFARLRHARPRSLKTFASAAPPLRPYAGWIAATLERVVREPHDGVVRLEAIALVALGHLRLHLAVFERRPRTRTRRPSPARARRACARRASAPRRRACTTPG